MPDFLEKAEKRTHKVCGPDEMPAAALFVRPRGERQAPFDKNCVLVLTEQRMLIFRHSLITGGVRGLIGEMPLAEVESLDLVQPDKGLATLTITLAGGTSFELTPGSRQSRFVDTFEGLQTIKS
jgi:hypothetical protein